MFTSLIGNLPVKSHLETVLAKRAIGNSWLFAGPEGVGKTLFAKAFGKAVLALEGEEDTKIHRSDFHFYAPEGKIGMHSIQAMRQFSKEVYMPPLEAKRKVFIIQDADRMLPTSANALLKTFEEPSLDSLIILVTSNPTALLPTILSRCRKLHFHALQENEIAEILQSKGGLDSENSARIAGLAQGSAGAAFRLLKEGTSAMRDRLLDILSVGVFSGYKQLMSTAQEFAKKVEEDNLQFAEEAKAEMTRGFSEKPTAVQQQEIDKEIDGLIAMKQLEAAKGIFETILSWYRDLNLLHVGGSEEYLINRDILPLLQVAYKKGFHKPVEEVDQALRKVRLALERSTSLTICLEGLFLRLDLI